MFDKIKVFFMFLLLCINIPIILLPTAILLPDFYHILIYNNDSNLSTLYIFKFITIYFSSVILIFYSLWKLGINIKYLYLLLFQYIWFLFYFIAPHILFWIDSFEKEVSNISQTFWITCLLFIDYFVIKYLFNNNMLKNIILCFFIMFIILLIIS